jgi:aminopeptidase N
MRTFGKTPKMIDLFSRLTGADYPYEKYAQSVVYLFNAGGMENTSTTTLHELCVMDERAALDQDLEGLIAHELAHQWFGDMITCKTWAHIWLNEGFASYFDALWQEYDHGRDAYDDDLWHTMRGVADQAAPDPRGGMVFFHYADSWENFRRGAGNNPYSKGASVLHMLRQSLGDELFFRCIAEYVKRSAWKPAESDDLRKVIEDLSGRSYERFFQQWVYRSGAPDVRASYEWDHAAKIARVTLEQRQEFTFETPAFACDVDVWLVDPSGNVSKHTIAMDGRSTSGALPCASEPKQVVIDPNNGVLMKLEPDLPTGLLVEQALRGPTTMARFGAIAALAKKDHDQARAALREILFDEKTFHGLRNEAAKSLGAMQTDSARAILTAALANGTTIPHHKVRRAVVEALGQYRHPDVAKALVRYAQSDPSYAVEAEASKALGKQDPTEEVVRVLAANAEKKSWRDQIRTAAVEALGNLGDARGIESSMKLASYGQPFRSRSTGFESLGKLARSVDEKQRNEIRRFLVSLMRDPQERAARGAINALGAAGDDRAIDELRKFADSSAPDELRQAARGAIDAINAKGGESTTVRGLRERIEALERNREDKAPATSPATQPAP